MREVKLKNLLNHLPTIYLLLKNLVALVGRVDFRLEWSNSSWPIIAAWKDKG
jgi:hypothetical protein